MPADSIQTKTKPLNFTEIGVTSTSALVKTTTFHFIDTGAKRFQLNATAVKDLQTFNKIIFGEAHQQNIFYKWKSLGQGLGLANFHKIWQYNSLSLWTPYAQSHFEYYLGGKSIVADILSGFTVGTISAAFLMAPDTYKVRAQTKTNQTQITFSHPYKAFPVTILRNTLFLGTERASHPYVKAALVKYGIFAEPQQTQPNETQEVVAKATSATVGTVVNNPADVLSVRVKMLPQNSPETAWSIAKRMWQVEGGLSFGKAVTTRASSSFMGFLLFFGLEANIRRCIPESSRASEQAGPKLK